MIKPGDTARAGSPGFLVGRSRGQLGARISLLLPLLISVLPAVAGEDLSAAAEAQDTQVPPLFEAPARADRIGRVLVPVYVNRQGPYRFVLDTGANRTVLTPGLARTLALDTTSGGTVTLSGVTGSASVPTVHVDQIAVGTITLNNQQLPVADSLSPDVQGVLGVDTLGGTRVLIDFISERVQIRRAHREGVMDGLTRIPAQCRMNRLVMIKGSVNRTDVSAVIDTGSEYTLGNLALRNALGLSEHALDADMTDVIGETLARQRGERRTVPLVRIGGVQAINSNVIFGDFHVFRLWDLESVPALVVGMDMIGTLDTFLIDYQRCEIQVRTRASARDTVR